VGISLVIGLGPFTWITLSFYLCLYHPNEWRRLAPLVSSTQSKIAHRKSQIPALLVSLLVTAHLAIITLASFLEPMGAIDDRREWDEPGTHAEFAAWAERLDQVGVSVSADELKDALWRPARAMKEFRSAVLAPLQPYLNYCGARQGWHMFVAPHVEADRYEVDVREGGDWRTVYAQQDRAHRWLADRLEQERLRDCIYQILRRGDRDELARLAEWMAGPARRDFPHADALRLRVGHYRIPTPQEARSGAQPSVEWAEPILTGLDR
jgi:hypothetical protein